MGIIRRPAALALWYGWACLLNRNIFIGNPSIPYIGWLLLASVLIPNGEPLSFSSKRSQAEWSMCAIIYWGAWGVMAFGYSLSGFHKWGSPSWQEGSALRHVLENPLARDWPFREMALSLPEFVLQVMTWGTLAFEAGFILLCLHPRTRMGAWFGMVFLHLGILATIDFADLTIGMLLLHLFTFDSRWIKTSPRKAFIVSNDKGEAYRQQPSLIASLFAR